jgi:hypothetical protein
MLAVQEIREEGIKIHISTGEINNRVNEILAEVETSARYAKALKNNFMWHDKKKSLRKDVQNAGVDFLTGIP